MDVSLSLYIMSTALKDSVPRPFNALPSTVVFFNPPKAQVDSNSADLARWGSEVGGGVL